MVLTRAQEQRLSRLEEMVAELGIIIKQQHAVVCDSLYRARKGKKENLEDQALNDEELVETEVVTDSIETEHGTVNLVPEAQEENPKAEIREGLVHKAILEEESMPQFQEMEEFSHQSTNGNGENVAHQVFGKMSRHETLGIKKKTKGFKSWRFKFKMDSKPARINHILHQEKKPSKSPKSWKFKYKFDEEDQEILQSRTGWIQEVSVVICFLLRRHLHLHLDCEEPELAGRKRNHGVFIQLHSKQKQSKYSKCWMFKFRKKKIDQWLDYNLIVAYLGNKKTWTKLRVRDHDNLTWKEDASDEIRSRSRMKLGDSMITCKNLLGARVLNVLRFLVK